MADKTPQTKVATADRRRAGRLYGRESSEITGPLQDASETVRYRAVLNPRDDALMVTAAGVHVAATVALLTFILWPSHLPVLRPGNIPNDILAVAGLVVLIAMQLIGGFRSWVTAYFVSNARDPVPMRAARGLKVAVLTTIVPGKSRWSWCWLPSRR